jgi:predicted CXXCH cytochrome family protein
VDCLTCHDPHPDGAEKTAGARLRMPILRRELCLVCHRQDTEDAPRVEIVSPLEGAIVQESRLALIGRATRLPGVLLSVRLNGSAFFLHEKEGHFFTWLKLQDGVNHIEIAQEDRILWKGEVFHAEGALDSYGRTSSGHGTGSREECLGCHLMKEEMSAETRSAAAALCYGCHDRIEGKRYVHGPLAVGDCLVCHDPHGGFGTAHLRQEQGLLCRDCHPAREISPKTACTTSGKGCMECHDPHQSDTRYLLKGPQYTMRDIPMQGR